MRSTKGSRAAALGGFLLAALLGSACATVEQTDSPLVPVLDPVAGHLLAGSFLVTTQLPKNQPTVVAVVGFPNLTQLALRTVKLDCQIVLPPNAPLPRKIVLGWTISDANDVVLETDAVKIRIRKNGTCKPKMRRLEMNGYAPGTTAEVSVTAKKQPLLQGAFVRYEAKVQ